MTRIRKKFYTKTVFGGDSEESANVKAARALRSVWKVSSSGSQLCPKEPKEQHDCGP